MPSYIEMPKLSDTMTEGTVVKWRKAVGDMVETGDVLAEVETDKAVMELEAFAEGTLSEVYVPEGGKARIGERLASLAVPGEANRPKESESQPQGLISASSSQPPLPAPQAPEVSASEFISGNPRLKASPLARKLAAARGVELASIKGSGPGGRVVARDVEAAATIPVQKSVAPLGTVVRPPASAVTMPATEAGDQRLPLSGMRKIIAERLLASKTQIPHFYLHIEVDAGELVRLRAQLNAAAEKAGLGKLTVTDFILKAAVMAAVRVPRVNASFAGDALIEHGNVHLSVAVAVEEGLVTPVIREAQNKSLREISEVVKDLAIRARTKKLKPEEYQGGTLTVSNLGNYGIESFCAIINPPQSAILAVGAIVKKPVVNGDCQIVIGERMSIGLSADHRVVDGAVGAQYLAHLRSLLETPLLLLL